MKFLILLVMFSTFLSSQEIRVQGLENKKPERVLYIGNSYFYYNDSLHNHVRRMLEEYYSKNIDRRSYKSITISGAALSDHNIKHSLDYKSLRMQDPFELVIVHGGSGETFNENRRKNFSKEIKEITKEIKKSGAESALYMIHALVEPHDYAYPEMINDIQEMYIQAGIENNALVIPVGLAFEEAYNQRSDIQLHKPFDGSHPDLLGTYLSALVVYSSITHQSPKKINYDYFGKIRHADKIFLQEIANSTVENFYNIKLN